MPFEWTSIIPNIVAGSIGLLSGLTLNRFSNRTRVVYYSKSEQYLSHNIREGILGNIEISLNGEKVEKLKLVSIVFENNSSADFENVIVKFSLNKPNIIRGSEAYLSDGITWLTYSDFYQSINNKFSQGYSDYWSLAHKNDSDTTLSLPQDIEEMRLYIIANQEFNIPVFNREHKYIFNFLVEEVTVHSNINISIIHKGLKLRPIKEEHSRTLELIVKSAIVGLIVTSILITAILSTNEDLSVGYTILFAAIGASYSLFGLVLVSSYEYIRSKFN